MRRAGRLIVVLLAAVLCGCEDSTFRSSVPAYPVRAVIDTRMGPFVHFQPTDLNSYCIINREGYFLNGQFALPSSAMDAYGYGGLLVFVSINGFDAYDLACPYCATQSKCRSCRVNGMFAECPECGEHYDLSSGTAAPQNGLIRETLRRLNIINSDGKLTISQQ